MLGGVDAGSRRVDNPRPPSEAPMDAAPLAVPLPSAASFANYLTLEDA